MSTREREDGKLVERIVEIFQQHRGVYGRKPTYPRCPER